MNNLNVAIVLHDATTGKYYTIPVTPPTVDVSTGAMKAESVEIVNLGDVDFPGGTELAALSVASFFPAKYDPSYCATSDILDPQTWRKLCEGWKQARTGLQVVCTAIGMNQTMYVADFTYSLASSEGDLDYTLSLKELRLIRPKKVPPGGSLPAGTQKGPSERTPLPGGTKPKTYTVRSGDTLTLIAKRLKISDWHTLYNKNKSVIGPNPDKIYPGQVLQIP